MSWEIITKLIKKEKKNTVFLNYFKKYINNVNSIGFMDLFFKQKDISIEFKIFAGN